MSQVLDAKRQNLMKQVLKYWYTVDFLNQADIDTGETLREKDTYNYVMENPFKFTSMYRHDTLQEGKSILEHIHLVEQEIESRKKQIEQETDDETLSAKEHTESSPCCHGNITVYIGCIDHAFLSFRIAQQLHCEQPRNPSAHRLALACFKINDEGNYIRGSFSISPIVWANHRIAENAPNADMYEILEPAAYLLAQSDREQEDGLPLYTYDDIFKLTRSLINETVKSIDADEKQAGIEPLIHYSYSIYRNQAERQTRETADYQGLSLSFFSSDLNSFRNGVERGEWGDNSMWNSLIDYVCAPYDMANNEKKVRYDLSISALKNPATAFDSREKLRNILAVEHSPMGKWPSKNQPFLMQQASINLALNTKQSIFAVNGPPGTGKTSLLREIIADYVVKRAYYLSRCTNPDALFMQNSFIIGNTRHYYYSFNSKIAKQITRYAIVLASSNNNAVENISKQLPLVDSLNKNLQTTGDNELAAIGQLFSLDCAPKESFERINFEKEGHPRETIEVPEIYFSELAEKLLRAPCWGLISAPLGKRSNIITFYKHVLKGLTFNYYRQKHNQDNRLSNYQEARNRFLNQFDAVNELRSHLDRQSKQAESEESDVFGKGNDSFICLSDRFFDDLCSDDIEKRKRAQMSNPYTTVHYDCEREKLFHAALVLTKEFIVSSDCCRDNFALLGQVWGADTRNNIFNGLKFNEKEDLFRQCVTPLIQTLQLLVPVISTTFASAGTFFKYVNKVDALGTVIVDEAGQATPQMALRLFSKASKAIIVGDPNQIEPVVSDELSFLSSTLDKDIGKAYSDKTISVQKIADYLSCYGGRQQDALSDECSWIGIPLYIHSRCVEPMFSISNHLSYGDTMLRITPEPSDETIQTFCHSSSEWIQVEGQAEDLKNHFVPSQGEAVLQLLNNAFRINAEKNGSETPIAGPDLFIISPFHTVAEGMRFMINTADDDKYPYLKKYHEIVENWLIDDNNPHIGTVHTFQGREANEVIFLLGCDNRSRDSANWVNKNIVNVAVSRAKYRLYVIGDERVWNVCRPVMEMKKILDKFKDI